MPKHNKPSKDIFVEEYLKDLNATQAAKRAGYSEKSASTQGNRLLQDVKIKEKIDKALADRSERTKIDADYVLTQAVKLHEMCMDKKTFNSTGAVQALKLIGDHVGVQAFKENVEVAVHVNPYAEALEASTPDEVRALVDEAKRAKSAKLIEIEVEEDDNDCV